MSIIELYGGRSEGVGGQVSFLGLEKSLAIFPLLSLLLSLHY